MKPSTIQSAFQKTEIWPLNRHAIPPLAFEPSKNTTMQATQPLHATLPSILVPTPNQTPTTSATTATTLHRNADTPVEGSLNDEEEPMEQYHIAVPPLLPGTSSWPALRAENRMLQDIIAQAGIALEKSYAQMKLMDLENERLRKQVFEKGKRKMQNKFTSGHA